MATIATGCAASSDSRQPLSRYQLQALRPSRRTSIVQSLLLFVR